MGRTGILKFNGKLAAMDARKSACGEDLIVRYDSVVEVFLSGDGDNK
jgi:hypothetical protein